MATSLTVPCTAREPMLPPGKKIGSTVNESVDMATRPDTASSAPSLSRFSSSLPRWLRKSSEMRRWEARPPLP